MLAPRGGGAPLLVRAVSGHPQLAAFNDGGLVLSLLEAADGDGALRRPEAVEGDSAFDDEDVANAVSAVLAETRARRPERTVEIMGEFLRTHLESVRTSTYALHAAGCAERVDTLAALFPDATIVHVVRDPRAVVLQTLRIALEPSSLDEMSTLWLRETAPLMVFGAANPGRVVRVPYESLLSDPHGTCERLCRALDLPPQAEAMAATMREGLREDEEYVFQRDALDEATLSELERALQPLLALLGFRPASLPDEGYDSTTTREGTRRSLADEAAHLREERDRYLNELQELRYALAGNQQLPLDIDVLRWKAKRYDRMRAAATPLRVLKRLRAKLRR